MTKSTLEQTTFTVSRSLFRDFLNDLVNRLNKVYPIGDTSLHAERWHQSGIGCNSKWRDIIAYVDPNPNANRQQPGTTVVRKLIAHLTVVETLYSFEYHGKKGLV